MLDGTLFQETAVQEEHFYDIRHKRIYQAMKAAANREDFIDLVAVTTYLEEDIYGIGRTTYLLELVESVATTATFKQQEHLAAEWAYGDGGAGVLEEVWEVRVRVDLYF